MLSAQKKFLHKFVIICETCSRFLPNASRAHFVLQKVTTRFSFKDFKAVTWQFNCSDTFFAKMKLMNRWLGVAWLGVAGSS